MIEDPILIYSQLVGMDKNNKKFTKMKMIGGLIVVLTQHTVLAAVQAQYKTYILYICSTQLTHTIPYTDSIQYSAIQYSKNTQYMIHTIYTYDTQCKTYIMLAQYTYKYSIIYVAR